MKKSKIKLIAILLVMFILSSCVKPNVEDKVASNNLRNVETVRLELTKEEEELRNYINEKSIIYSTLSFEEKKEYYNKIFYLFKSPNCGLRTEMFDFIWSILRNIEDRESDVLNFLLEKVLSDEGIFYNIGSENTDDVLVRAYSLRVVSSLINRSNSVESIDENDLIKIKDKLIEYIYLEKDRRGYIEYIGDSYSFFNWIEAIESIILVLKLTDEDKEELINVMSDQIVSPYTSFNGGEDVRLAGALSKLIFNSKDTINLELFLNKTKQGLKDVYKNDKEHHIYVSSNVLIFLKTLYFRTEIMINSNKEPIQELIIDYISSIHIR